MTISEQNSEQNPVSHWAELRARHLVETDWLDAEIRRGNSRLRIVDMRGHVRTETDAAGAQKAVYLGAAEEYALSHIPGALYLDWTRDIVDLEDPVSVQLAPPDKMATVLGRAGIDNDSLIVAYDAHPASQFATRLWWALRAYGHENVRVLNGGWAKWMRDSLRTTTELPHYPPTVFTPQPRPEWRATAEEVRDLIGDPDVRLLDARDEGQYTGQVVRGSRGGHIPGAHSLPREALFQSDGTFHAPEELLTIATQAGASSEQRNVAYCNGGVAATSVLFALSMLGYPHLANYDGSWNEWAERADLPVEQGTAG